MLDVGQGDGLVIRGQEGKTYFMDGGSSDVKLSIINILLVIPLL